MDKNYLVFFSRIMLPAALACSVFCEGAQNQSPNVARGEVRSGDHGGQFQQHQGQYQQHNMQQQQYHPEYHQQNQYQYSQEHNRNVQYNQGHYDQDGHYHEHYPYNPGYPAARGYEWGYDQGVNSGGGTTIIEPDVEMPYNNYNPQATPQSQQPGVNTYDGT
jgi:hypothetical protein